MCKSKRQIKASLRLEKMISCKNGPYYTQTVCVCIFYEHSDVHYSKFFALPFPTEFYAFLLFAK